MKILVACEESQRVCTEMRRRGHEAYSCDIQEPSGGHPEWHIQGNVLDVINPEYLYIRRFFDRWYENAIRFETMDKKEHIVERWDLIIAHPPCTYLSAAGAVRLFDKNHQVKDPERLKKGYEAADFFRTILNADCDKIAVENPVPLKIFHLPKYDQNVEPFMFGDPWREKTCLWLKNLPKLEPTEIVEAKGYWIGAHGKDKAPNGMSKGFRDQKTRSKTFPGIAAAMAEQWAGQA